MPEMSEVPFERLSSQRKNDAFLRETFAKLVQDSAAVPSEERLVMYDACDEHEIKAAAGPYRKRLDDRRNAKPKKPDAQLLVCTPFDPNGFNFSKIRNPRERLLSLEMEDASYELLTNKFPLFKCHMLLTAKALVPQQMTRTHLAAITQLLQGCSFSAYFNSWMASASVNHFHCHLIDEQPPVTAFPLVVGPLVSGVRCLRPDGFAGDCYVFPSSKIDRVDAAVQAMQASNQPHNLLFTQRHIYVFPKPLQRPARSSELYPETVGGPELIGSFTVYKRDDYDALTEAAVHELVRINTAPLPGWILAEPERKPVPAAKSLDELSRTRKVVPASRSFDGKRPRDDESVKGVDRRPLGVALARSVSFELVSF